MARIRSIKPEFWSSEQVMECSTNARLLFIGLWNFCDDAGRHPCAPKQIKALVFPGDDLTSDDVMRMLNELASNGLIELYDVGGKGFLQVTGWHHQKIDKPQAPRFPGRNSDTVREAIDDRSANGIDGEDRIRERKGKDKIQALPPAQSLEPAIDPGRAGGQAGLRDEFVRELIAAVGTEPCRNDPDFGPVEVLLSDGCTEADVLAGIAVALAKTRDRLRHWSAFSGWVRRARDDREAGARRKPQKAPPPGDDGPKVRLVSGMQFSAAFIRDAERNGQWFRSTMGPKRGEPGCLVPDWVFAEELA